MAITWRNNEEYQEQIDEVKNYTGEKSTTKAIEYSLSNVVYHVEKVKEQKRIIEEKNREIESLKRLIHKYCAAKTEMNDIAKKWQQENTFPNY